MGPLPPFAFLICFLVKYHTEIFKPYVVGLTGWITVPHLQRALMEKSVLNQTSTTS